VNLYNLTVVDVIEIMVGLIGIVNPVKITENSVEAVVKVGAINDEENLLIFSANEWIKETVENLKLDVKIMLEFLTEKCFEKLNEVSIKRPDDVVRIKEFPDVTFIKYGMKGVKDEE
jgi:S-adenosylmethionine synthetase